MHSRLEPRSVGKAYVAIAGLVGLLVAALAGYAAFQGRAHYDQMAALYSRNTASAFERHVRDAIERTDLALLSVIEAYGDRAPGDGIDSRRLERLVGRLLAAQPEIATIRVTDAAGLAYVGPDLPAGGPFDMSRSESFVRQRDSAAGGLFISRPYFGPLTKKWGIALSRPLHAADGSFAGVVVALISTDGFKEVLSTPELGARGFAHLHGADESIVFSYPAPAGKDPLVGHVRASPEAQGGIRARTRDVTFFSNQFDGVRRATTLRQVGHYPLFVDVAIDPQDFMAGWRLSMLALAATVVVALLVLSLGGARLYRSSLLLAQSEAHWRDTADNLQLTIDAGRFGIWERDMRSGVLTGSATALEIWGFPQGTELTFDRLQSVMVEEDRGRMAAAVAAAIERHSDWNEDYRVAWPDGSVHWVNSVGRVHYAADGRPERIRGVVQEVSARKAAEQSLLDSYQALRERTREVRLLNAQLERRAIDAETAVRARDAFMRNVSHELRTPLNHIIGGNELLLMEPHDPAQERWLQMVRKSAVDLLARVNQILEAARLEAGDVALAQVEFSPATVLEESRLLFAQRAAEKGTALEVELDPDVPDRVLGDPQRVAQGLMNYIDNALKFTDGGTVTIGVRPLPAEPHVALLRFEVRDTGPGLDAGTQARLFEPFVRGDPAVARAHEGLGVGLSTTRDLARLMGGEAGLDAVPGHGSLFWFTARFDRVAATAHDTGATGTYRQPAPQLT